MSTIELQDHRFSLVAESITGKPTIYSRGNTQLIEGTAPLVAVTGARACSNYGTFVTAQVAEEIIGLEGTLVSGGSSGIDAVVLSVALSKGVSPVIILPGGLDRVYPAGNRDLIEKVVDAGGLLISLFPDETQPTRERFKARSQFLGSIVQAVVLTQANFRSGSILTARSALENGIKVGVIPGAITDASMSGCNRLLNEPGVTALVTDECLSQLF